MPAAAQHFDRELSWRRLTGTERSGHWEVQLCLWELERQLLDEQEEGIGPSLPESNGTIEDSGENCRASFTFNGRTIRDGGFGGLTVV